MKDAIIIGCGGHAHVVAATLVQNQVRILGFLDDNFDKGDELIYHGNLLGKPEKINQYVSDEIQVYLAQGNNEERMNCFMELSVNNYDMPSLIHPSAYIESDVEIGNASLVCLGVKLAVDVRLGKAVIVNTGVVVDHESLISDFSHLAPGVIVAGRCKIGKNVFIGMGAKIDAGISIGDDTVIGAGSIVLKNVPEGSQVYGVYH